MPQSYNHLFPQIIAFENLLSAYQNARKGKKQIPAMHAFHFALKDNLWTLHQQVGHARSVTRDNSQNSPAASRTYL